MSRCASIAHHHHLRLSSILKHSAHAVPYYRRGKLSVLSLTRHGARRHEYDVLKYCKRASAERIDAGALPTFSIFY